MTARDAVQWIRALTEVEVVGVRYLEPIGSLPFVVEEPTKYQSVGRGVELDLSNQLICRIIWEMRGFCEGLIIGIVDPKHDSSNIEVERRAIVDDHQWSQRLPGKVTAAGIAWHRSDDRCEETIWSVRLLFGSLSVTIALGEEKRPGLLAYQPDNLIVIFDAGVAKEYVIPASIETAWGSDCAL